MGVAFATIRNSANIGLLADFSRTLPSTNVAARESFGPMLEQALELTEFNTRVFWCTADGTEVLFSRKHECVRVAIYGGDEELDDYS